MVASSWPSGLERSPTNVSQVVQITAAGKTAEDASWLLDKVRGYMTDTVLRAAERLPELPEGTPPEEVLAELSRMPAPPALQSRGSATKAAKGDS